MPAAIVTVPADMSNRSPEICCVVSRQVRRALAHEAGRNASIIDCALIGATERVVTAGVDFRLQEVGAYPALRAVTGLLRLTAAALRRNFPVPVVELAAQADERAEVVGLDVPLARAGVDRAKAADLDARWRRERIVRVRDGHREPRAFVQWRRRALCDRGVVLYRDFGEELDAAEILVAEQHQARCARLPASAGSRGRSHRRRSGRQLDPAGSPGRSVVTPSTMKRPGKPRDERKSSPPRADWSAVPSEPRSVLESVLFLK